MMIKQLLPGLVFLALAACGQDRAPDDPADTGQASADTSGVEVRVIRNGYGRAAEPGDYLTVHTTGWLYDENAPQTRGEKFWSSHDTGDKFNFTLGAGNVIQGWDRGIPGMLIGEVRELTIPPELGYGERGRDPIPPNATLVFEIELFDAESLEEAAN